MATGPSGSTHPGSGWFLLQQNHHKIRTVQEWQQYAARHGLCPRCAYQKTHAKSSSWSSAAGTTPPAGAARAPRPFRSFFSWWWSPTTTSSSSSIRWVPLTLRDPVTPQHYLVYQGYCLAPTCYTLTEAKQLLGETTKHSTQRTSSSSLRPSSSATRSAVTRSSSSSRSLFSTESKNDDVVPTSPLLETMLEPPLPPSTPEEAQQYPPPDPLLETNRSSLRPWSIPHHDDHDESADRVMALPQCQPLEDPSSSHSSTADSSDTTTTGSSSTSSPRSEETSALVVPSISITKTTVTALLSHPDSPSLILEALGLLVNLAVDPSARSELRELDCIQVVTCIMMRHSENQSILALSFAALNNLVVNVRHPNVQLAQGQVIDLIQWALHRFSGNLALERNALMLLKTYTYNKDNLDLLRNNDSILDQLVQVTQTTSDDDIVRRVQHIVNQL